MRLKRIVRSAAGLITRVTVFLAIAVIGGGLSSWYAIESGTRFNTQRVGSWTKWSNAGRPGADPYSRQRFNKRGELIFNADLATRHEALVDSLGRVLHSSCDYVLEDMRVPRAWWTLAVFSRDGALIPNPAHRYGFNAATVARQPDGSFSIHLARDAKPFNWLPTGGAGTLAIVLEVQPHTGRETIETDAPSFVLPTIKRLGCR